MNQKHILFICLNIIFIVIFLLSCSGGGNSDFNPGDTDSGETTYYTVTYVGNDYTGGTLPIDDTQYETGDRITVMKNTGALTRSNHNFEGWNTRSDGTGYSYSQDDVFTMESSHIILYAKWMEIFNTDDRPSFDLNTYGSNNEYTYKLMKPWDYDKIDNNTRKYPLIISLHGYTSSTTHYYAPTIVGNDTEMQAYPCFFFAPNNSSHGWGSGAVWVRTLVQELKQSYRIDEDRIYLMGYSMGGSGSYKFANSYYDTYGEVLAGIVRLAGQSETAVREAIADQTSIWYHIGLTDTSARVTIAEQAYQFIKNYTGNAGALESIKSDVIDSNPRLTKTLTKNAIEIMKKSEYTNVGHSSSVPFKDPAVLPWLFNQNLKNR